MKTVKVLKKEAEKVRRMLIELNLLDYGYKLHSEDDHLYLPIKEVTDEIKKRFKIVEKKLERLNRKEHSLIGLLKEKLSEEELSHTPKAFEIVGDIAIIEIPEELEKKEKAIGESLLKLHKNLKVVAKKAGQYEGEYRTRKLKIIAGKKRKETIHKENNSMLKVNPETCYFSPRLSTERKRIIGMVNPGEDILVMFSGVAPYPITIARNTKAKSIVGIEINPEAHKYAEENIKLNRTWNVKVYQGDVKEIVPGLGKKFDRILMPLPKTAEEFLPTAMQAAKKGTIIHMYDFLHESEIPKVITKKVKGVIPKAKVLRVVKCGQYSPGKFRVCIDFKV